MLGGETLHQDPAVAGSARVSASSPVYLLLLDLSILVCFALIYMFRTDFGPVYSFEWLIFMIFALNARFCLFVYIILAKYASS